MAHWKPTCTGLGAPATAGGGDTPTGTTGAATASNGYGWGLDVPKACAPATAAPEAGLTTMAELDRQLQQQHQNDLHSSSGSSNSRSAAASGGNSGFGGGSGGGRGGASASVMAGGGPAASVMPMDDPVVVKRMTSQVCRRCECCRVIVFVSVALSRSYTCEDILLPVQQQFNQVLRIVVAWARNCLCVAS